MKKILYYLYDRTTKKDMVLYLSVIVMLLFCIYTVPYFLFKAPIIHNMVPSSMISGVKFNADNLILISGENLKDVTYVKVNGVTDTGFRIIEQSDTDLKIQADINSKRIKTGVNYIELVSLHYEKILIGSKKMKFEVESDSVIPTPSILSVQIETIDTSYTKDPILLIRGSGFIENSAVELDGKRVDSFFKSDKEILMKLKNTNMNKESFSIQVSQYVNGAKTSKSSNEVSFELKKEQPLQYVHTYPWLEKSYLIQHALGGVDGRVYTNSREALNEYVKKGSTVLEIDLTFTADTDEDILIGRHDWLNDRYNELDANIAISEKTQLPKTLQDTSSMSQKYHIMSFEELCKYMSENPEVYIVTDTKYGEKLAVEHIFQNIVKTAQKVDSTVLERIIVQIYNQSMYSTVMEIYPFQSVIYTLYMSYDSNEEVLEFVEKAGIGVVTMPISKYSWEFVYQLNQIGCKTFLHTINSTKRAEYYMDQGVYGVYTDYLMSTDFKYGETESYASRVQIANHLRSITEIEAYLVFLRENNYISIFSVKDDGSAGLSDTMQKGLYELGAGERLQERFRDSYMLISQGGEPILERISSNEIQEYSEIGDLDLRITSAGCLVGNRSSVIVNGDEKALDSRGLNIVVYDEILKAVVDSVAFDTFESGEITRNDAFTRSYYNYLTNYLEDLQNENYIVCISVMDDATTLLDDKLVEQLKNLGMDTDLRGHFRESYLALLDGGINIYEKNGEDALEYDTFYKGLHIRLSSAGLEVGNRASILIDGVDYAVNSSGLNIVVYDKRVGSVIDSIAFRLNDQIEYSRK